MCIYVCEYVCVCDCVSQLLSLAFLLLQLRSDIKSSEINYVKILFEAVVNFRRAFILKVSMKTGGPSVLIF